jgi:hypothetical protein
MVLQKSVLNVLGLHDTVSTDWLALRWLNTDYSQSYCWTSTDGTLFAAGEGAEGSVVIIAVVEGTIAAM